MQILSTKLSIGNTVIKNRAVMAPVKTGYGVPTGEVTSRHLQFFERRSRHVGAVTPEPFCLHPTLRELPVQIGIHSDDMLPGLNRLSDVIHTNGALAIAHLNHPGRMANPAIPGNQFFSSSGRMCLTGVKEPEAMDRSRIEESQEFFEKAAIRAQKAGYDFVELQFGHGYLIAQFLSEAVNDRTDQYGGSWGNRLRYGLEVLKRVKKAVTLPIIVRLSADEMTPNGLGLDDALRLAVALEEQGVNALHISSGSVCETPPWYFQHMAVPKGKTWDFASRIREKVGIPVIAVGQINEKDDPETILQNGMADAIAVGRALIADPDFIGKVLGEITDTIRPCASCLEGCLGGVKSGKGLMCVVNPAVGKAEEAVPTVEKPRKVAVVGGGPAGMEAALILDERGHDVTLYEKDKLGGLFNLAHLTPRKGNLKRINDYLIQEVQKKIPVVSKEADVEELIGTYDTVIAATGSHPQPPDIPGLKEWSWAEMLQEQPMPTGKKGVIVGGGFIGAEMTEILAKNGNDITILKRSKEIAPAMEPIARKLLLQALEKLNIPIITDTDITRVEDGTVYFTTGVGEDSIEGVDFIVYTKGMVSESSLKEKLSGKVPVYSIGDCREIGRVMDAIHDAYDCAMSIG